MNKNSLFKTWAVSLPWLFFLFFLFCATGMQAQTDIITGTVTDEQGGLPGATVAIKGKASGTLTDENGKFSIQATPADVLVFSYLGYMTVERPVGTSTIVNISLQQDTNQLREVVVNAGYYSVKDKERTGSIARITSKEIGIQPVNTPLEALQGRMAGVEIVQTSGVPGSGFEVKIRGQNSIMAGNAPLYIIDGVPYDSKSLGASSSSLTIIPSGNISPLNAINPATIESIEVLKDADATAIYGSRGANGVVLITTKRGKQGKTNFTFGSSTGIANITRKRDLMDTQQYLAMRREAYANDGITTYPANAYDVNGTWDENRYTDWQKELIGGTASTNQIQGSVSGGSETTQLLLSGMYQNETTVFPGDFNYDRITVNSNINHKSNDKRFELVFSAGYTAENNLLPGNDLTNNAYRLAPNAPALYDESGNLNWENSTWTNPLAQLEGKYTNSIHTLMANTVLNYRLFETVLLKLNTGYNTSAIKDNNTIPNTVYNPAFGLSSSTASQSYSHTGSRNSFLIEPQLNWVKKGENHSWNVLLGTTFQSQKNEVFTALGIGYADNSFLGNLNAANSLIILNENKQEYRNHSVFARVNYGFNNKIFINATGRRDGSSRFGLGNRYGNFGAVGAAWLFSDELKLNWLNYGKLRGSYGITGNDQIADYQYLQTYSIADFPYDGNIGLQPTRLYNPSFKWEENVKKEMAVELGMFNNNVSLAVAYFNNRSNNQLLNYALPGTTGFTSIQANLDAIVENAGWEADLGVKLVQRADFNWNASVNLTLPKNELLAFPGLEDSTYANQFVIGQPLSIVKLYQLEGVNPETGVFEFRDFNNDGAITAPEDRQYVADLTPKWFGGLSNSVNYKNWNFDVFFQFVKKEGFNEFYGAQRVGGFFNQSVSVSDHWQQPGDQAFMQQYTSGANPETATAFTRFSQSSATVSDASFVRLKSMAVSYTLPFGKERDKHCRIALQGQNLLTFTKFKGADPEQSIGFLPPLRRITLAVQLHL